MTEKTYTCAERIDTAFGDAPRENFVLPLMKDQAELNQPLPIGEGQTISQPSTVRLMLEWLDVQPGDKILDVGSGSGWTTALLSSLAGPKGNVCAVERVPELVEFGKKNVSGLGVANARFFEAGPVVGLPAEAPFDRILVSASARTLPMELIAQLKVDGKAVVPVHHNILEITKTADDRHDTDKHAGFVFVPLI